MGGAVGDDPARGDLADSREGVELLDRGGVEVDRRARLSRGAGLRAPAHLAGGARGPGQRGHGLAVARNADLLAVGDPARQVDRLELGPGRRAAGRLDGVHDPAAGRQPDESRAAHPPHHVHGDLAGASGGPARATPVVAGDSRQRLGAGSAQRRRGGRVDGPWRRADSQQTGGGDSEQDDDGDRKTLAADAAEQPLQAVAPAAGLQNEGGRR